MRIISILLYFFLFGCMTMEELKEMRQRNLEYYNSEEYREHKRKQQCEELRDRISRGTDKDFMTNLFDTFRPIPQGSYGRPIGDMLQEEEGERVRRRLTQYKIEVESYRTLCR